jgi:hypothetical protein
MGEAPPAASSLAASRREYAWAMQRAAVLLVVLLVGCGHPELPEIGCRADDFYLKGTSAVTWYRADDACVPIGPRAYLAVPNNTHELVASRRWRAARSG